MQAVYAHAVRAFLAVGLIVGLAGCGGENATIAATTETVEQRPVDPSARRCEVSEQGSGVAVVFRGPGADAWCADAIRTWSVGSAVWTRGGSARERVRFCRLQFGGRYRVDVLDTGSGLEATSLCGRLVESGWNEVAAQPGE